jgi:hypothetical protein
MVLVVSTLMLPDGGGAAAEAVCKGMTAKAALVEALKPCDIVIVALPLSVEMAQRAKLPKPPVR